MILPAVETLAIEPLSSAAQGSPSTLDTYRMLALLSNSTDSGILSAASVSHFFVSVCGPAAKAQCAISEPASSAKDLNFMGSPSLESDAGSIRRLSGCCLGVGGAM